MRSAWHKLELSSRQPGLNNEGWARQPWVVFLDCFVDFFPLRDVAEDCYEKGMKMTSFLVVALSLMIIGCASPEGGSNAKTEQKQPDKNPEVGMTKEQVIALYGKTDNIQASSEGETWIYHLNMGEAFIPFNFGYRPKIRIINFDRDGKVARWSYTK